MILFLEDSYEGRMRNVIPLLAKLSLQVTCPETKQAQLFKSANSPK